MSAKTDSANLDFLRASAVLAVYFCHALQTFNIEKLIGRATIYDVAQTGVLIFFVHTSLVLMLSLNRLDIASSWRMFAVFYIRRAFRIYPLSVATVLIMLAAHAPDFPNHPYSWPGSRAVLSNLTLTQNLTWTASYPAVLWSLPYEVQMYIILPLLFVVLRRFSAWWLPIILWAFDVLFIVILAKSRVKGVPLLIYTPCFLAGVVGYRLWSARRMRLPFFAWPMAIISFAVLRVLAEATSLPQATTLSAWSTCLLLGFAVPQFRELGSGWTRTFASAIAKYSYGIYLSHSVVFWIAFILMSGMSFWIQCAACLILSVLFPLAMYHALEKPMINVGVRIASQFGTSGKANELSLAGGAK
jgi:peptidoglycan/LPS O-acetylase OafA/YrhL